MRCQCQGVTLPHPCWLEGQVADKQHANGPIKAVPKKDNYMHGGSRIHCDSPAPAGTNQDGMHYDGPTLAKQGPL
eukprot:scaffold249370_cov25-Tisochrysis_lutea.AAC.1